MPAPARLQVFGDYFDPDFHRASSHIIHGRFKSDKLANLNGFVKVDAIHRNRHTVWTRMPGSADISNTVSDGKDRSSLNCPRKVGMMRHHQLAHFGFGICDFFRAHARPPQFDFNFILNILLVLLTVVKH